MKKIVIFLTMILLVCGLTACNKNKKYDVEVDTLYVSSDMEIMEVTFEPLDTYGSYEECKKVLDKRMSDYNYSVGGIVVWTDEIEQVGVNSLKLRTGYANYYSYAGYKNTNFVCAKISEAKVFHYDYVANYVSKADGSKIESKVALADEDNYIVYIKKDINIQIDGTILYYSDNVEVLGENLVKATADDFCCIIFK